MYKIFKAESRGQADYGWLRPRYYFSFSNYYNPARMGFGSLRVINDDWVAPGAGFPTHPHKDMEIITIPLEGSVAHKDSSGGEGITGSNEVQVMTAGKGIYHSEFNASKTDHLQLFQIWIEPSEEGLTPSYDQQEYVLENNKFTLLVNGIRKQEGVLFIHQQACIHRGTFSTGKVSYQKLGSQTGLFILLISGKVSVDDQILESRDWIEVAEGNCPEIKVEDTADILIIETV